MGDLGELGHTERVSLGYFRVPGGKQPAAGRVSHLTAGLFLTRNEAKGPTLPGRALAAQVRCKAKARPMC